MKIIKSRIIEIDMKAERERINRVDYTLDEELNLLKLCELFEVGKFDSARMLISTWKTEWREYIAVEMWNILINNGLDIDYNVIKNT